MIGPSGIKRERSNSVILLSSDASDDELTPKKFKKEVKQDISMTLEQYLMEENNDLRANIQALQSQLLRLMSEPKNSSYNNADNK